MFKTKTKSKTTNIPGSQGTGSVDATSIISDGTMIEGTFNSKQNIRLDGHIVGDIKCEKLLLIGEKGKVKGKVFAETAVIMGQIDGEINIKSTLTLKPSCTINGPLAAGNLIVEEGAKINGQFTVGSKIQHPKGK